MKTGSSASVSLGPPIFIVTATADVPLDSISSVVDATKGVGCVIHTLDGQTFNLNMTRDALRSALSVIFVSA